MNEYLPLIDARLNTLVSRVSTLSDAMRYSLLAGGKRLRPMLAMDFCTLCGEEPELALDPGCAVELIHTYSLIHDDLPCMDNDALRRGRPTCHVVYGDCTATLAGDALQALAFETVMNAPLDDKRRCDIARCLAHAAGHEGMCYGQYLDMEGEGQQLTAEELDRINLHKTGDLIAASCQIGCIAAGADEKTIATAAEFGYRIGLAFQIRDDILDVISSAEELGKPIGSDNEKQKNTYFALLGQERCQELVRELSESALELLEQRFTHIDRLRDKVIALERRSK